MAGAFFVIVAERQQGSSGSSNPVRWGLITVAQESCFGTLALV